MICKYCGSQYAGNRCPSCGKTIPLMKRSMELDRLMSASVDGEAAGVPGIPLTPPSSSGTERGQMSEYLRGLKEGYDNGYRDGSKKAPPFQPQHYRIARRALLTCALIFFAVAIISGLIGHMIGYNKGHNRGMVLAMSTYEPQIAELKQQHQADVMRLEQLESKSATEREEGNNEAVRDLASPTNTPIPSSATVDDPSGNVTEESPEEAVISVENTQGPENEH